ncbi:MAG: hypothetical protein C4525_10660 [Desulfarculus sp.]|nr:MAG: hypothetical protein C4525_10660 [Desulfarculus sp.]
MSLKETLSATGSRVLLGSFLGLSEPALVELVGRAGYDFIILDGEHGSFSGRELEECLRAADMVGLPAIVRVRELNAGRIQAALDAGAQGVQIPAVETAPQASEAVAASRFPPRGGRGYGSTTRASGYGFLPRPQVTAKAAAETAVIIQIETRLGVENLASILAVEGVDAVFIGTSDLSLEYGYQSPSAPEMMPQLKTITRQVAAAGKVCGVHVVDWKAIAPMLQLGVRYFTVSALAIMGSALGQCLQNFLREVKTTV